MAMPFWLKSSPFWLICVEIRSVLILPSWPQWKRLVLWHLSRQPWIRFRWWMLLHPQGKIFSCLTLPDWTMPNHLKSQPWGRLTGSAPGAPKHHGQDGLGEQTGSPSGSQGLRAACCVCPSHPASVSGDRPVRVVEPAHGQAGGHLRNWRVGDCDSTIARNCRPFARVVTHGELRALLSEFSNSSWTASLVAKILEIYVIAKRSAAHTETLKVKHTTQRGGSMENLKEKDPGYGLCGLHCSLGFLFKISLVQGHLSHWHVHHPFVSHWSLSVSRWDSSQGPPCQCIQIPWCLWSLARPRSDLSRWTSAARFVHPLQWLTKKAT